MTLEKAYNAETTEQEIWSKWERARAFHAEPTEPGDPYAIVIPPPNVTAALHLGHALNNTLQDVLVRWRRMAGDNAVWLPGTDHAGIATQTVVEKRVLAEEGKRRTDFERDAFVAKIQAWKDEYEATITNQLKKMGCSCDWDRQAFTMDEPRAKAVREAFFQLFKDGLIYRGKRLVNWDPATQTALADDEVEMEEIDGHFWYMRYPLVAEDTKRRSGEAAEAFVTVATTRPETMLGDTAVAVNPDDPERAHLIGRKVRLPIVNREIPIVGDDYVVIPDPESDDAKAKYASGCLKVTPAHDPNDYEIGRRHDLAVINVMAPDGSISKDHGWLDWGETDHDEFLENLIGMDRYEAREAIVEWFRRNHLLEDVRPYRHAVGHSYRSHVAIEPYLSDQWYVKVTDERLAGAALRAMVEDQRGAGACTWAEDHPFGATRAAADAGGALRFTPERYARTFQTWHENIRDWCISRQLWWGHRIPVWSREGEHEISKPQAACRAADGWTYVCLRWDDRDAITDLEKAGFTQDPDVLDTWFSSALWPLSTLGWPEDTAELARWNPTSVLSTAREIITLWVSRMVMFNEYFRGCVPFTDVFIHAMIQDGDGRKMSKSLGNGVDPLDIIHSHGADAMRFTLVQMTTQTQDVRMPVERDPQTGRNTSPKFDIGRNFANKLWNATRFVLTSLAEADSPANYVPGPRSLADRWILSRAARTIAQVNRALGSFDFHAYGQTMYQFVWNDLCDWYIEVTKPQVREAGGEMSRRVLATVIDVTLRLLHPSMPFITEKLFEELNRVMPRRGVKGLDPHDDALLARARWPQVDSGLVDGEAEMQFERLQELVTMIREVRASSNTLPRDTVEVSVKTDGSLVDQVKPLAGTVEALARVKLAAIGPDVVRPEGAAVVVRPMGELYLHQQLDASSERERLGRRLAELQKSRGALSGRLNNKGYVDKAPSHLVQETRDQLASVEREIEAVQAGLASLG